MEDFINVLALKNQLINANFSELMRDYQNDYDLYLQFLNTVCILLKTDSGFLLFSKESIDKIFNIVNIHRFDTDDKEVIACINDIIGEINNIRGYSAEVKKMMMNSYLAFHEDIRKINILNGDTLIQLIANDALCLFNIVNREELKDKEEYMFLSSLNYLIYSCPELFEDEDFKNEAMRKVDIVMKKGWPFNSKGRNYSKKTKENLVKVKTLKEE